MLLPEFVLDSLIDDNASGIRFFCIGKEKQKEVAEFFKQKFEENFEIQKKVFEEEIGDEPDDFEVSLILEPEYYDDYVTLEVLPLDLSVNDGTRAYNEFGNEAFDQAVRAFAEKYPDIKYDGCIQYAGCDEHCGDTISYELGDEAEAKDKVYDFVGRKLENSIADGYMLEELSWMIEGDDSEKAELLKLIDIYGSYLREESKESLRNAIEEL